MVKFEKEAEKSNHPGIFMIVFILIVIVLILLFGTKIYLWLSVLLGNDIIINLIPDKENLFLNNNQYETVTFESSVITSPFCDISCSFNFTDLSEGNIIESNSFKVKTTQPIYKEYSLLSPLKGTGQKLFRFDIHCIGEKTFLCNTLGELEGKSSLITLNYNLSSKDVRIKDNLRERIQLLMQDSLNINNDLTSLNETYVLLNSFVEFSNISYNIAEVKNLINNFSISLSLLKIIWEKEEFDSLSLEIEEKEIEFYNIEKQFVQINNSVLSNFYVYNSLIDDLNETEFRLLNYQGFNMSNESLIEFNNLIINFNNISKDFYRKTFLSEKEESVNKLKNKANLILKTIAENKDKDSSLYQSQELIYHFQSNKINFTKIEYLLEINFNEILPQCCLFEDCRNCCNDSCYTDSSKYPIIFLHGHGFSKKASAETNLNIFDKIQRLLEKNGYLNAGSMLISSSKEEEKGIFGKTFYPVTLKVSYYFDIFKTKETTSVLQTKKDSIDTYAIRLKDIVKEVKYKTNREKVIIIAYSMGGLVTRRYLQLFGEDEIEKLILIATPNNGISDEISVYCSLFGEEQECKDMNKDSLFINKLNNAETPKIPVFNIVGLGCEMVGEQGDGVVKNSSAYLSYAKNYFVEGECGTIEFFHEQILNPVKYPEVYNLLVKILKEEKE